MTTIIDLFKLMDDNVKVVIRNQYNEIIYEGFTHVVFQQLSLGELLTPVEDIYYSPTYKAISLKVTL